MQPRVNPQGQPIRQQRQPSPYRQGFNPLAQPFIPAAEAQPNTVPNTPENKVPKSSGGQAVKSSAPDGWMCFRCKQPRHLKKDCPEQPYCSRCHTRGYIPVKCQGCRTKATNSRMKHIKMVDSRRTKDAKTPSEHKISPSFQTQTTDVSIVQVIMDLMIVQRGINTRHDLPTILLVVQV